MINYRCYKAKDLIRLLGNDFYIINKNAKIISSNWVVGDSSTNIDNNYYITNKKDIKEIIEWDEFWKEITIKLSDNTQFNLYPANINSKDKSLLRIVENNFFSPTFKFQDDYILSNKELDSWLLYNGVEKEELEKITTIFYLYPTYVYEDIYEPIIENDKIIGYYCDDMKLSEKEIDMALEEITNVKTRLKIEKILKSFEKVY